MSFVLAWVLFGSGASRPFVSTSLCRGFNVAHEALAQSLKVDISVDITVLVIEVYRDCVVEIFGVGFPIDLIPIAVRDVCVVAGMDWLSRFGALIDCKNQLVTIRDPNGGVLTIYREGTMVGSSFYSAARAIHFLQHRCTGYLAYVVDTRDGKEMTILDGSIMREFPDVFLEEFPGVPPKR